MAAEKKTKTVVPSPVKETPVKEAPVAKKVEPKKAEPKKTEPKKAAAKKAAPKKPATVKAAPKKVTETVMVQAAGSEWDVAAIKEQVIAGYVAEGHQRSGISSLTVYVKPEERKAYYVVNGKTGGSVDI